MSDFTIVSQAQHEMLKRAATDPDYAKSRGFTPELATKFLDAHKAAGSPQLPERAPPANKVTSINDRPKSFGPKR